MEGPQVSAQADPSKDTQAKHLTNTQVLTKCGGKKWL